MRITYTYTSEVEHQGGHWQATILRVNTETGERTWVIRMCSACKQTAQEWATHAVDIFTEAESRGNP